MVFIIRKELNTMPVRILSLPLVVIALVFLYLTWEVDEGYSLYIIPPVVLLGFLYTLSPQINWWWYKRHPPELDAQVRQLFNSQFPYYQALPVEEKKRFRQRVALYMIAHEFTPQAMEKVPEDIKAIIGACAVQVTFGMDDFLLSKFERIIIYPHPFPSPQYPDRLHTSEIFEEDGVVIFSAEHLTRGFLQPKQYYNSGLHEYAKVFRACYPDLPWPEFDAAIWDDLERISGFKKDAIFKWINLDDIEPFEVSVAHFFVFPQQFRDVLPEIYSKYVEIFGESKDWRIGGLED
jgi:Mlc titration factor MtfA (ptsG expression regulator)